MSIPDTMLERTSILVPVILTAQGLLVHWAAGRERPPAPPDLSHFSAEFSGWKQVHQDPVAADVQVELRADRLLSSTYLHPLTNSSADLFVAWFQSQRAGASQPHSPKVCLPGSGWIPESAGEIALDTAAGAITVNRYIVAKGKQRAVVLYWYQTPRRVVAGEWAAKLWLVADAVRDNRSDTALVRVVVWSAPGHDDEATAVAAGFARKVYPLLRGYLPHQF
jgi:EpsI family protein